jgi:hypothetical protein
MAGLQWGRVHLKTEEIILKCWAFIVELAQRRKKTWYIHFNTK